MCKTAIVTSRGVNSVKGRRTASTVANTLEKGGRNVDDYDEDAREKGSRVVVRSTSRSVGEQTSERSGVGSTVRKEGVRTLRARQFVEFPALSIGSPSGSIDTQSTARSSSEQRHS